MKILEKRPGEILFLSFIIGGLVLTAAVAAAEQVSGKAGQTPGRAFESGIIDGMSTGASWYVGVHGK